MLSREELTDRIRKHVEAAEKARGQLLRAWQLADSEVRKLCGEIEQHLGAAAKLSDQIDSDKKGEA